VSKRTYIFARHALQRMAERNISREVVEHVVEEGETIHDYPDDTPYRIPVALSWGGVMSALCILWQQMLKPLAKRSSLLYTNLPDIWNKDCRSKEA
jgi:hypothetical protein